MKLENITAELRPRSNWEAADLGGALTRRDYGAILLRQAILIVPLWALLALVFSDYPGWALLFLWWLKPIYERVPLFYLSRSLFGGRPSLKETLAAAPRLLFRDLFMALGMTRPSVSRSVFQPVNQLEGLRWGAYFARAKVLRQYGSGGGLTMVMALLEVVFVLGLVALATLLLPFTATIDWQELALTLLRFEASTIPASAFWMLNALYATAVFLLVPFYSGAGFGIYINSRTLLEGWDIELSLRQLGERLSSERERQVGGVPGAGGKAAVLALLAAFGLGGGFAWTAVSAPDPKNEISGVLADPDFEIHKVTRKVPVLESDDLGVLGDPKFPSGASAFGTVLFYMLIAFGAGVLVWMIWLNRHLFSGGFRGVGGETRARTVMGMEIDSESLPVDIPAAAMEAWKAGDIHRAVNLLYRGSICWLVERGNVRIRESDTEHDCLMRTRRSLRDPGRQAFFTEVTDHWILQAYGDIPPAEEAFRSTCQRWPFALDQPPDLAVEPANHEPVPTG